MAENPYEIAQTTIDIASDGDIILTVGKEENKKLHLRVDSYILRSASSVFKAMLGPNFMEGRQLYASKSHSTSSNHQNTPTEVKLPDDDPLTMKILCQIMHGKIKDIEVKSDADVVLKIATTADKYFLDDFTGWNLAPFLSNVENQDIHTLAKLVVGAIYFDDPWSFEVITQRMILNHTCAFDELVYPSVIADTSLWKMIHFLSAKQSYEQCNLIHELWAVISALIKPGDPCRCAAEYERALRSRQAEIRSNMQVSLSNLQNIVGDLMTGYCSIRTCPASSGRTPHLTEVEFRVKIRAVSEKLNKIRGLCLDCVKSGRKNKVHGLCRFHP